MASDTHVLLARVVRLQRETPLFVESLAEVSHMGSADAAGLYEESRDDSRGQLRAFLEDFAGESAA